MKTTRSRPARVAAIVLIAAFGVAACDSQPSAKRVAEDIVNTLTEPGPVRDCMLAVIDTYSQQELDDIGDGINAENSTQNAEARAALDKFEADLAACRVE